MVPVMLAALLAAGPSADTAVGRWRTETKNAIVDIQKCGASLCGRLVTSDDIARNPAMLDANNPDPAARRRALKGSLMLSGFRRDGDAWVDGQVYKADEGRTYSGRITPVDADHIKLRGCVFVPLCRTQTWTRVD